MIAETGDDVMTAFRKMPYRDQCLVFHGYWVARAIGARDNGRVQHARYCAEEARQYFAKATGKDT